MNRHDHFNRQRHTTSLFGRLVTRSLGLCILGLSLTLAILSPAIQTWEETKARWSKVTPAKLRQAAESGQADAQYYLGMSEWEAGVEMLNAAYDQWNPLRELAGRQERPSSTRTNWTGVPEPEIRRAAESGDRGAQSHLSRLEAEQAAERARSGIEWLKKAAAQGFPAADYQLAIRFLGILGWRIMPLDNGEGVRLLRKASDGGHPNAQLLLGEMLISGSAVPADLPAAIDLLRRAADQGLPRAQCALAEQYSVGHGEPRHEEETPVALFRKAAESGLPAAQFSLAERYRIGLGVATDYFEAIPWYRRAVTSNQLDQATVYVSASRMASPLKAGSQMGSVDDRGDPQFAAALQLYFKAVNSRDRAAQASIGDYYARNQSAEHATAKACFWYGLAGAQGLKRAVEKCDELKRTLTEADSQRIARWTTEFNLEKP